MFLRISTFSNHRGSVAASQPENLCSKRQRKQQLYSNQLRLGFIMIIANHCKLHHAGMRGLDSTINGMLLLLFTHKTDCSLGF